MTRYQLRVVTPGDIDRAIAALDAVRIERADDAAFVESDDARAGAIFATSGVELAEVAPMTHGPLRTATVSHLVPYRVDGVVDVIRVRRPSLGESIALVRDATRDLFGRHERLRRTQLATLLAETDDLLVWRRVVMAPAALLRHGALPGARPVVFDPRGVERARERITFASSHALTCWITA